MRQLQCCSRRSAAHIHIFVLLMRFALFCMNFYLPQACWQQRAKSKFSIRQIANRQIAILALA